MSQLFQRRVNLIIAPPEPANFVQTVTPAVSITGLRVQFHITKTITKEPNVAEISVSNLNKDSRAKYQDRSSKIVVLAGYEGTLAQIFSGEARTIDHEHQGPTWVTKIQCGDGERAYRFAYVNANFGPGTAVPEALKPVLSSLKGLGIDVSGALQKAAGIASFLTNGYAAQGQAVKELDSLLQGTGYAWSIQDGVLNFLLPGQALANAVVLLTPTTGLVGSPEHGSPDKKFGSVLKVKSLLQPEIRPGGTVQIKNTQSADGTYFVEKVVHTGDTHGGDWYSEFECRNTGVKN